MPDFGLSEALAAALKASRGVTVVRPAEAKLAEMAARTAPEAAAPTVPVAAPATAPVVARAPSVQTPSAEPAPGAVQAPPIDPSVPPQDVPPPAPEDAAAQPTATAAPPDVAAGSADSAPPSVTPDSVAPPPETLQPPAAPEQPAQANALPPPVVPEPPIDPVQEEARRFITANLNDFPADKLNMTHMPNVDVMQSPDGLKAAILQVADDNVGAIDAARRGTITDQQLIGLAQDIAANSDVVKQVLTREFGESIARPEVMLAARMIEQQQMGQMAALAVKVADGSASSAELIAYKRQRDVIVQYLQQLMGAKAEWGRAGRGLQIPVGLPSSVEDHIASVLKQANPDIQAEAQAIRLANTPGGIANIVQGTNLFGRTVKASRSLLQRVFINGILSGPPTWAKIFVGNTANQLVNSRDLFVAGIGRGLYGMAARNGRFFTPEEGVALSDAVANMHGIISGGADALRVAGRVMKTGQSMDNVMRLDPTEIAGMRAGTLNPAIGPTQSLLPEIQNSWFGSIARGVDTFIDAPGSRIIAGVDDFTKTLSYRGYLTMMSLKEVRARLSAGSIVPGEAEQIMKDLMTNPDPAMQQAAEDWAHRATFQSPFQEGGPGEAFSNFLSKAPALRFVFPFMRTATNIFKQSVVERTPFAIFSARIRAQIAAGGFEGDLAKARIATGTAIGGMLAWMAVHDRITGDAPKDARERQEWALDGRTANSVRITDPISGKDTWRDFSWFEPMSTVASLSADIVKTMSYIHSNDEVDSLKPHDQMLQDAANNVVASIIQNTGNKTFMQGAAQFSEMYNDPQKGFQMWASDIGASMVPYSGMLKFARNMQDPYLRQAQTLLDKVRNEFPTVTGVDGSRTLAPSLDVFGEPRVRRGGNSILGPLSPLPGSDSKRDAVTTEVQNLMEQTRQVPLDMPSRIVSMGGSGKGLEGGNGMRLTAEEYADYVQKGRSLPIFDGGKTTFHDKLTQTMALPVYQAASPAARVEFLRSIQNAADEGGRALLYKDNEGFRDRITAWTAEKNRLKYNQ